MNIDKKALKAVVDEIEASRTRQKGETEFQREALKRAAKNHQLDAKAVRIVLQRRAMGDTKRDEQDYYVHAYEMALGGKKDAMEALERGASTREAAKIGGISNGAAAALAKGAQKSSFVSAETPHDPKTGEIRDSRVTEDVDGEQAGRGGAIVCRHSVDPLKANEPESEVSLAGEADAPALNSEEQGDRQSPLRDGGAPVATSTAGPAVTTLSCSPALAAPAACSVVVPTGNEGRAGEQDPLDIPPFLRRERVRI